MGKIKVGLIFGGKSGEHEVSVRSAASVYRALDKTKYDVHLFGIDKQGKWLMPDPHWLPGGVEMKCLPAGETRLDIRAERVEVFFPIIHGTYGEDGCLQGLLEMLGKPYVGAGVLGSAVGMDKDIQKRLLIQAGITVVEYQTLSSKKQPVKIKKYPVFVKPASLGSSVGVTKVHTKNELAVAIERAFKYDNKILIEEYVEGREIECAVLGNEVKEASCAGEIIPIGHEFYDYEAKYIDENGARLTIPARISAQKMAEIRRLAIKACERLEIEGMARVDLFLKPDGKIVLNEVNTLPGFTNISMYPRLWEASGMGYSDLLDRLIELAIERNKRQAGLVHCYN